MVKCANLRSRDVEGYSKNPLKIISETPDVDIDLLTVYSKQKYIILL